MALFGNHIVTFLHARLTRLILFILCAGPMPAHVAFIMDGNRRYSRCRGLRLAQGHNDGFLALRRVLEMCMRLHIRCVSVYGFAIDNFKRSDEEVTNLMHLAKTKLDEFCSQDELLHQYGVRLNVLGDKSLLPADVQAAVQRTEHMTRNNDRAILNLCMPYASTHEMASAVEKTVHSTGDGILDIDCVSECHVDANLFTSLGGSPPLDILVRSSGVKRLSDFLLWQCSENTQIHFTTAFWPDYGLREFIPAILAYQRRVWFNR